MFDKCYAWRREDKQKAAQRANEECNNNSQSTPNGDKQLTSSDETAGEEGTMSRKVRCMGLLWALPSPLHPPEGCAVSSQSLVEFVSCAKCTQTCEKHSAALHHVIVWLTNI